MTDPALERRALTLFEAMLDIDEAAREAWLLTKTGSDVELKQRVTAIWHAEKQLNLKTGAFLDAIDPEPVPDKIGAYRITGVIGSGGMGTVFSADRDAEDFEHSVAIKLIKHGFFTEQLVERFNRERQILAQLNHPNIARLFDGGTTETGQPYIVMERIPGIPLLDWVNAHRPDQETRLRLFLQVCSAAGHAHRNLVVHRDLTPANVLVDEAGDAKLIDFGIARPEGEEQAALIVDEQPIRAVTMTPGYAAPERISGDSATVLSDIYSAGKMLEALLAKQSESELAAIIAKATADDPQERYLSTEQLADDVRAYLKGQPVSAMPGTTPYRLSKFYRRNRLPVLAGVTGLIALTSAFVIATTAYFQAERARQAEATRVEQLRNLANYMLFDHNEQLAKVIGNGQARKELVNRAQSYLLTLSGLAENDPSLSLDIARGFVELARIQGVSAQPNFGDHELALANLDRAESLLKDAQELSAHSSATKGTLEAYRALILMHAKSKPNEADAAIARGMDALDSVTQNERGDNWDLARSDLRRAQFESSDLALNSEKIGELVGLFNAELATWSSELKATPRFQIDKAISQFYYATHFSYGESTDAARSLSEYEISGRMFSEFLDENPNDPYALYFQAWNAYYGHGAAMQIEKYEIANELLQQADQSTEQLRMIEEHDESLESFAELLVEATANLDTLRGYFDRAITGQQSVISARLQAAKRSNNSSSNLSDLAYGYVVLGDIGQRANQRGLACESFGEAERLMAIVDGRDDLRGYVASLRDRTQRNIKLCSEGRPVSELAEKP